MFEAAIVIIEKIYFVCFLLAHLCIIGIKGVRNFVTNMVMAAFFSTAFAYMTWYSDSDKWTRYGKPFEGTECYLIGFIGWVTFTCTFVAFSLIRVGYNAAVKGTNKLYMLANFLFWSSFGIAIFSAQATYFHLTALPWELQLAAIVCAITGIIAKLILHFTERED